MSEINSNRVEIIDKRTSWCCAATYCGCCVSISLLITIFTLIYAKEFPQNYLIIPMFSVVCIIGILIFYIERKLGIRFCKFNISNENIEIFIHPGPWFKIRWSDIDIITVQKTYKRVFNPRIVTHAIFPEIFFTCKDNLVRTIQLRKFRPSYKRDIIKLLKNYAVRLNKSYHGLQEMKDMKDFR